MWAYLLKRYWQVSTFKESPANTPYSPLLLIVIALAFLGLMVIQWTWANIALRFSVLTAVFAAFTLVLSYAMYTRLLLTALKVASRFTQTLTCLFAGHFIIHLFALPLIFMPTISNQQAVTPYIMLIGIIHLLAILLLSSWQFMLTAFIYKEALSLPYFPAILASVGLLATNILTISFWR